MIRKPEISLGLERLARRTRMRLGAGAMIQLRLPRAWPDGHGEIYWHARSTAGALHTGTATSAADLPEHARHARVHVWTPPSETVLTRVQLPTRSRAKILQALPYALEDQLVEEPEKLHFAYTHESDGALAVAITSRARIASWVSTLQGAGVRPASMCPATLALPWTPDAWSLTFGDDEIWLRSGAHSGFACPVSLASPPPLLVSVLQEAGALGRAPLRLVVLRPPSAFDAAAWNSALGIPVTADDTDPWTSDAGTAAPLNLLQGEYAPAGQAHQYTRPLRPAIIMLAVLVIGAISVDVIEWLRLRGVHRGYVAEMHDIFRQSFPGEQAQYDPYAQMQRKLESLQARGSGPADLLPLLTRVAPMLQGQTDVKLRGLKYADRSLTLNFIVPSYQALDAFSSRLQSANLHVEVLPSNKRSDSEVEGHLRVQPAGAQTKPRPQRS